MNPTGSDEYIDTAELSRRTGKAPKTYANWRVSGFGPPFVKIGASVRYRWTDVEAWLAENTYRSTAETATK